MLAPSVCKPMLPPPLVGVHGGDHLGNAFEVEFAVNPFAVVNIVCQHADTLWFRLSIGTAWQAPGAGGEKEADDSTHASDLRHDLTPSKHFEKGKNGKSAPPVAKLS